MFIGHYAVGLAGKRFAPQTSLAALIAAPTLLDLLWPIFILLGWEQVRIEPGNTAFTPLNFVSYPFSHSLVAAIAWATLFALAYYLFTRYRPGAFMIWIGVVSHWFLDFVTHRPDMPIYPGGTRYGLGLWNHPILTVIIEVLLYVVGIWIYAKGTRDRDRIGKWGFWSFVVVLGLFFVTKILAPPPPNVTTMAIAAILFGWLLVLWAWWFDRHREACLRGGIAREQRGAD